jgi:hypothetical protein
MAFNIMTPPPPLGTIEIGWARVFQGSLIKIMTSESDHCKLFILHCSLAGFISAWVISGLLVVVDVISRTPCGTFFAVISNSDIIGG